MYHYNTTIEKAIITRNWTLLKLYTNINSWLTLQVTASLLTVSNCIAESRTEQTWWTTATMDCFSNQFIRLVTPALNLVCRLLLPSIHVLSIVIEGYKALPWHPCHKTAPLTVYIECISLDMESWTWSRPLMDRVHDSWTSPGRVVQTVHVHFIGKVYDSMSKEIHSPWIALSLTWKW